MNQWMIGNGELRAGIEASQSRYAELRRRSDEARMIATAGVARRSALTRLVSWLRRDRSATPRPLADQPGLES